MKHYVLILALIAFAFSLLAFFGVHGQVSDSSALALISICTTLIVGVSVVDVMRLQKLEKQMDELKELKKDVEKQKKEIESLRDNANMALDLNWGYTLFSIDPKNAIIKVWKAIDKSFEKESTKRVNTCIKVMNTIITNIEKDPKLIQLLKKETAGNVPIEITESMENSDIFSAFKTQIEKTLQKIEVIIKKNVMK